MKTLFKKSQTSQFSTGTWSRENPDLALSCKRVMRGLPASDWVPQKPPKRTRPWLVAAGFGMGIMFVALAAVLKTGFEADGLTIGSTSISLRIDQTGAREKIFEHTSWDGPTGEFSTGHEFALKLPSGVLELNIRREPLEAACRRLPKDVRGLIRALNSKDRIFVYCAAERLGELGAEAVSALPRLIALAEQNHLGAYESIPAIAGAAPTLAVPHLVQGLESTNAAVVLQMANVLGHLKTNATPAIPALKRLFRQSDAAQQCEVASALWSIAGQCEEMLHALMRRLEDGGDCETANRAVFALGQFGACAEPAVPLLVRRLENGKDSMTLRFCAEALRQIGKRPDLCVPALLARIQSPPSEDHLRLQRGGFILALGGFGTNGVPHLLELCRGTNVQDKITASRALIAAGPNAAEACGYFFEELSSNRPHSIVLACEFFGAVGEPGRLAISKLRELLASTKSQVKAAASYALIKQGEIDERTAGILAENFTSIHQPSSVIGLFSQLAKDHPELDPIIESGMQKVMPSAMLRRYGLRSTNTQEGLN